MHAHTHSSVRRHTSFRRGFFGLIASSVTPAEAPRSPGVPSRHTRERRIFRRLFFPLSDLASRKTPRFSRSNLCTEAAVLEKHSRKSANWLDFRYIGCVFTTDVHCMMKRCVCIFIMGRNGSESSLGFFFVFAQGGWGSSCTLSRACEQIIALCIDLPSGRSLVAASQ